MCSKEAVIELERVYCSAGGKALLRNLTWTVKKGEHWLIYGANGSGKTTLLSLIAGYGHIDSGNLKIFGDLYTDETVFSLRKKIGLVSASFFDKQYRMERVGDILLSALTGALGMRSYGNFSEINLAKKELERFQLNDKFEYPYYTLSKGEQQKILLARAFLQKADILLLDEPVNGLDSSSEKYIRNLTQDMMLNDNLTILYVSHHPAEFGSNFDHCIVLERGELRECSSVEILRMER